jgi:hypothetical protein
MGSGGARQSGRIYIVEIDDRHGDEARKLVLRECDLFVSTVCPSLTPGHGKPGPTSPARPGPKISGLGRIF